MARWIKVPFGMEVSLSPGDTVLHGDLTQLCPWKGAQQPPHLGLTGCMPFL